VFPAAAVDTVLLSPTQIRTITDGVFYGVSPGSDMVVTSSSYGMLDNASQVDPSSCVGIIFVPTTPSTAAPDSTRYVTRHSTQLVHGW
jgi:hypothetical protein